MKFRHVGAAGQWSFGNGINSLAQDNDAIALNIRTRLLSWTGDCFFALEDGIDWKSRLDVGQETTLLDEIRTLILKTPGVVQINSIDATFDPNTRALAVTYNVDTIFSQGFQGKIDETVGTVNA